MRNIKDDAQFEQEIRQAEKHMTEEAPYARTVALLVGATLLLVMTQVANASPILPPELAPPTVDHCATRIKNPRFAGTFVRNPRGRAPTPIVSPTLRFVIGEVEGGKPGTAIAQIWEGEKCQASCSAIDFDYADLSMPISLDLQCHGSALGASSTHVAVLWDHGAGHSTVLRIGSWIEGYEQAALKVETDRFTTPQTAVMFAESGLTELPVTRGPKIAFRNPR